MDSLDSASLYLHIPFCAGKCAYCDFYSVPASRDDSRFGVFIENLLRQTEAALRRYSPARIPTVYIGGGTPSVLGARSMACLLSGLSSLLDAPPGEFTVEANPESLDEDFLRACREGGVNRISLGVQSFHLPSRRAVGRVGAETDLDAQLALVSGYYPRSFSADLMAGLPFQSRAVMLRDIERLLAYEPAHVSLYSLTLEDGTALAEDPALRALVPPTETADEVWLSGRDALEAAGYGQYEVSSFALEGKKCAHNIRYWRMENWLGLGPSASGTVIDEKQGAAVRSTWPPGVEAWLETGMAALPEEERLDPLTLMKESLLMGFRCTDGPDDATFTRRFGRSAAQAIPRTIAAWKSRNFFARNGGSDGGSLRPSIQGLLFLNPFLRDVFAELEGE